MIRNLLTALLFLVLVGCSTPNQPLNKLVVHVSGGGYLSLTDGYTTMRAEPRQTTTFPVLPGRNVTMTAYPHSGYTLDSWGGVCDSQETECVVTSFPNNVRVLDVEFTDLPNPSATVSVRLHPTNFAGASGRVYAPVGSTVKFRAVVETNPPNQPVEISWDDGATYGSDETRSVVLSYNNFLEQTVRVRVRLTNDTNVEATPAKVSIHPTPYGVWYYSNDFVHMGTTRVVLNYQDRSVTFYTEKGTRKYENRLPTTGWGTFDVDEYVDIDGHNVRVELSASMMHNGGVLDTTARLVGEGTIRVTEGSSVISEWNGNIEFLPLRIITGN